MRTPTGATSWLFIDRSNNEIASGWTPWHPLEGTWLVAGPSAEHHRVGCGEQVKFCGPVQGSLVIHFGPSGLRDLNQS